MKSETVESTTTRHTLVDLTPGRLYNVTVVTEAGDLKNSRTVEARTGRERERQRREEGNKEYVLYLSLFPVPAPASNISVEFRNSTILSLSWQRPTGDLDALVVALSTNGTSRRETTTLPPNATEVTFDRLTPGSTYRLAVTSRSAELTSQSEISVSTAPAAAALLSLSPSSSGDLVLTWTPPPGHWERYRLSLFDGLQQLVDTGVDREAETFVFHGTDLTPGRTYRALLTVESNGLEAESSCEGSTAPAAVTNLHIRHSDETSLSAMWSHAPSGSRDGYFLTIRHGNRQMKNIRVINLSVIYRGD
ncbi:hypothetical protein F2P81_025935 [Scophthalmus maximus]|uniref:Fibronectin type-III domain-containing protein n=1 Tax=Scophthalmus maximus TaxID=52904 RepID=A0A6A4RS13_SCOMX|nr:hypothetical protein F2P81_025935 [Scophthalmus maximus]